MAFHTFPGNLFVEINQVGGITRAVTPAIRRRIIRNGQLKKAVIVPIKIRLSFPA
jgi:hypothetical protein